MMYKNGPICSVLYGRINYEGIIYNHNSQTDGSQDTFSDSKNVSINYLE